MNLNGKVRIMRVITSRVITSEGDNKIILALGREITHRYVIISRGSFFRGLPRLGALMLESMCLLLCTHLTKQLEFNSKFLSGCVMMCSFSATHNLHSPPTVCPFTCSRIFQRMENCLLPSFCSQICLVNSQLLEYFLCLNPWL